MNSYAIYLLRFIQFSSSSLSCIGGGYFESGFRNTRCLVLALIGFRDCMAINWIFFSLDNYNISYRQAMSCHIDDQQINLYWKSDRFDVNPLIRLPEGV